MRRLLIRYAPPTAATASAYESTGRVTGFRRSDSPARSAVASRMNGTSTTLMTIVATAPAYSIGCAVRTAFTAMMPARHADDIT